MLSETADCACLNLRGAARAVTQMFDETLKPSGLRATQFSVMAVIAQVGPASMSVISRALVMDRTTLTRNLKPLLNRRLVKMNRGKDRRQRTVALTSNGKAVLARALPLWKQGNDRVMTGLGHARWRGMSQLLEETIRLSRQQTTGNPD